jgi:protoheme IX farnesyltransferase
VGAFPGAIPFMLGCCNRRFWDRSWNIILIQFFGNSLIFGQLVGSCMKIMKRQVFLCCQQAKDKGTALQVILYTGWLIIASLLPS